MDRFIEKIKLHRLKLELISFIDNLRMTRGSYDIRKKLYTLDGRFVYSVSIRKCEIYIQYNSFDIKYIEAFSEDFIATIILSKHGYNYKIIKND